MHSIWRLEERKRRRKVLVTTLLVTIVVVVAAFLIGVSLVQCLLLATAGATVGAVLLALPELDDDPALPPIYDGGDTAGTRREVSRLSWVMVGHDNRVGGAPYHRLREIAATRLALRGVDLATVEGDRAAQDLLGALGYRTLIADAAIPPTSREFEQCVTLLERLDDDQRTAGSGHAGSGAAVSGAAGSSTAGAGTVGSGTVRGFIGPSAAREPAG